MTMHLSVAITEWSQGPALKFAFVFLFNFTHNVLYNGIYILVPILIESLSDRPTGMTG